jgi:tetratricopeptide (TPR) repeat protein
MRRTMMLELVLLVVLTLLVYLPALKGQFLWDDEVAIRGNPLLRGLEGLGTIWTTIGRIPNEAHWWPLTYTVLWLEHRFWDWQPTGYHLVNVLLHAAVCVQIWRLMRRLRLPGAWLGAALFAMHPVHVEAVAWIIELKDLLATGCYLLAAECFLNGDVGEGSGRRAWLTLATLAMVAAMLSKSVAVTLPVGLAILIWYRRGRLTWRDLAALAPLAAVALAMGLADWVVTQNSSYETVYFVPALIERVLQAGRALWFYAGKLAWPRNLSSIYPQWRIQPSNPMDWLPLAGAAAATAALWLARRRIGRGPLACWLFYGVTLSPMLGILHFYFLTIAPVADRFQYLASLGPLIGVGALVGLGMERIGTRRVRLDRLWMTLAVLAALVLALLATLTWRQAALYRSQETLFRRAVEISPQSPTAYSNLGSALLNEYRLAEARSALETAVRLKPDHWQALCNLGTVLFYERRLEEARATLEKAVRLQPRYWEAIYNLGNVLMSQGKVREAVALYRQAVAAGCEDPNLLNNLAATLAVAADDDLRDPAEALRLARRAVELSFEESPLYLNTLAAALAAAGRPDQAAATARRALDLARERGMVEMADQTEKLLRIYEQGGAYVMPRFSGPAGARRP